MLCPKCLQHFESFLDETPPDFSSRPRFFEWTVMAHNFVNRALNKREYTVEKAQVLHYFDEAELAVP